MASPGVAAADASVGDDTTAIATTATVDTATASASAPANSSGRGGGDDARPSSACDRASPPQERPKPVSAESSSMATSEAPSSSNSAYDDGDEDEDGADDHRSDDRDEALARPQGSDNDSHQEKPTNTKKRKMVKRSREERLEMNRMTARERRRKAKVLVDTLQERVNELTRHNEALRRDNTIIRAQLQAVTAQNSQNNQAASGIINAPGAIGGSRTAVSSSPSPVAAPVSAPSIVLTGNDDSSTAALLIRQLQQQQQQQMSSPANPSPGLQQIVQASAAANPTTTAPAAIQAQIEQLRQREALRLLGLRQPLPFPTAVTGIHVSANGATNFAIPETIALPTTATGASTGAAAATMPPSLQPAPSPSDLATSALSAYQHQHQPSQGMTSTVPPAQVNLQQLVSNNVAATTILQNLGLLGGAGALPTSPSVGVGGTTTATDNATVIAALSSPNVVQGATNASANGNALAQLLPALLQQQQQHQQQQQQDGPKSQGPLSN